MVDQYNFGGGDLGPDKGALQHPDGRPKTKKEIMEDIIAKSKMYKVGDLWGTCGGAGGGGGGGGDGECVGERG
jgi:hypothetical protein